LSHYGIFSILPAVFALALAIRTKRVIGPLLAGILGAVLIRDVHVNGWAHSVLYSIVNTFRAIAGHPANEDLGIRGMGLLRGAGRVEVLIVVVLLGAFIGVLQKSGGFVAFGRWLSGRLRTRRGAQTAATIMGCSLFTSSYFSCLATGAAFRPIFDRLRLSRAKLAFIVDSTSAPVMVLFPLSAWAAFMAALLEKEIPGLTDGMTGLFRALPFNFYCIVLIGMVFLIGSGRLRDFGPMRAEEDRAETEPAEREAAGHAHLGDMKPGKVADMALPLGVAMVVLVVLGLWNHTLPHIVPGIEKIPIGSYQVLILGFSLGLATAWARYTATRLMTSAEFFDVALSGVKSVIVGGIIIVLALTLGDLLRAPAPEGLGMAVYLKSVAGDIIPSAVVPFGVFVLACAMSFSMGTSWGVWAIMMPIALSLTSATGGNHYLAAAAVFSGGTFGDHTSPISDTTIMSSIGSECDLMTHVNTQLPYALVAAGVAAGMFLVAGFFF